MSRPMGDCPECGCDWGRHSMPGAVQSRVIAGEPVDPINTCPFCDCRNMALPPLFAEAYTNLFSAPLGAVGVTGEAEK